MNLGAFSVSLTVKDIHKSKAFYERLGFKEVGGKIEDNWLILRNRDITIGLFHGMFEKNTFTFNPGWNAQAQNLDTFTDIRELQKELEAGGAEFVLKVDETTTGPGSLMMLDPDGNPILIDQHR